MAEPSIKQGYHVTKIEEVPVPGNDPLKPTIGILVTAITLGEADPTNPTGPSASPTNWRYVENAAEAAALFEVGQDYDMTITKRPAPAA